MGYTAGVWAVRPDGRGVVTEQPRCLEVPAGLGQAVVARSGRRLAVPGRREGVAACVEAKTGKEIWKARLGGDYSASPICAGGRIYFFDESGTSTVIEAGPAYKVIAVNRLDDGFMASPAVSGGALYLRTKKALYRIEEKK